MRLNRIYVTDELAENQKLTLTIDASRHLLTVLKMQLGQSLILFNDGGDQYIARIIETSKKSCTVEVIERQAINLESPLDIHLIQGISRGDKMDFTIQKAVELGVSKITPLISERCGVKLNAERMEKRMKHWQKVIVSACEQSGRNCLPKLAQPLSYQKLMENPLNSSFIILNPHSGKSFNELTVAKSYQLIIGPEGGLSDSEVHQAEDYGCQSVQLGPRILRTETAGMAAISLLQGKFGDF